MPKSTTHLPETSPDLAGACCGSCDWLTVSRRSERLHNLVHASLDRGERGDVLWLHEQLSISEDGEADEDELFYVEDLKRFVEQHNFSDPVGAASLAVMLDEVYTWHLERLRLFIACRQLGIDAAAVTHMTMKVRGPGVYDQTIKIPYVNGDEN